MAEGRSTGVPKILRAMRNNGSPSPIFETDDDRTWFLTRLPVHVGFSRTEEHGGERDSGQGISLKIEQEASSTDQVTPQVTDQDNQLENKDNSANTPQVTERLGYLVSRLQGEMSRTDLQTALWTAPTG